MLKLVAFRNAEGDLGFIQKNGDAISYFVNTKVALYSISGGSSWHSWVQQVEAGYLEGDKEEISINAIAYFLNRYAETINIRIVEMHKVENPGSYYPRIYRENIYYNYVSEQFLQDVRAYQNIQISLDVLFNYIEPAESNLKVYGHKIRELLILACTEVECLLVKTLTDNGYEHRGRFSTNDYIKCKDVLGLGDFEVSLTQYPNLKIFRPFANWITDEPTKSLQWYNAYNAVKHNRSDNISDANLEHLLDAISAIHILLESQYGKGIFERWNSLTEDRSIYKTTARPTWTCKQVSGPELVGGYDVKGKWTSERKYFEDFEV